MQQTLSIAKQSERQKLQQDVDAYLAAGGQIRQFPPEASGNPENPFFEQLKVAARKGGRAKASATRNAKQRDWASHRAL